MKRKTRIITVNKKQYVWWYNLGESCAGIKISPLNDKTSIIEVNFSYECKKHPYYDEYPQYLTIEKNNLKHSLKITEPKMVSILISYLSEKTFISRKTFYYDGFNILSKIGYKICKIKTDILL